MNKWNKPQMYTLAIGGTKEFGIEELKSEISCDQTPSSAIINKGKGCSYTSCKYYEKKNNGNGNGGKCGGSNESDTDINFPISPIS